MAANKAISPDMSKLLKSIGAECQRKSDKEDEFSSIIDRFDRKKQQLEELESKEKFFTANLLHNPAFESGNEFKILQGFLPDLAVKYKRTIAFYLTLGEFFKKNGIVDYRLDKNVLSTIIDCYMDDLTIIKKRCGSQKIQLPKIAGLMTSLIVKYRPIVPRDISKNPHSNINETFAVYHALCICSDFSDGEEFEEFRQTEQHDEFFCNMIYLLNRNFTPESLIMTYRTLCMYQFKSFLRKQVDG